MLGAILGFLAGFIVGALAGIVVMCLISASKYSDDTEGDYR